MAFDVTDQNWPDEAMKGTRGVWVRQNAAEKTIEIWHDGHLEGAWRDADKLDVQLIAIVRHAFECGIKEGKRQVRVALGIESNAPDGGRP